jgi:4-hydroxythreonine-4-phosphate dehydrogenase
VSRPRLALTQGDPAGIGPEILLKCLSHPEAGVSWDPVLVAEWSALEGLRAVVPETPWPRLRRLTAAVDDDTLGEVIGAGDVPVLDPVSVPRTVEYGRSSEGDARGALAALNTGLELTRTDRCQALVTAPVSKASIARHVEPEFRGHTEYLAAALGLERYGRDYLMTFLGPDLQVALLSTHEPLIQAVELVTQNNLLEALQCLHRHAGGRIAVAGLNPHAGEGGLLGEEDEAIVRPAVAAARAGGIDATGPESPDSVFARARDGEFDWVMALYHDQGLIAVKTAAFGSTTNWTLGLPVLRTSVDHGTAFGIAGQGVAEVEPLLGVVDSTLGLLAHRLPRRRGRDERV